MTKNINYVSHKKSKVKNNGKPQLPSASSLVEGEIAINYAKDVETLSIKNESGTVVTFSSDNYYTEQKLGSGFTGSGVTVTDAINEVEEIIVKNEETIASALNDLKDNKVDVSAYTPVDLTNYYTKEETSGKTEISNALGGKVNTATFTGHTADTNVHLSGNEKTNLDLLATNIAAISGITADKIDSWNAAAGTDLSQYYKKTETSGATELSTAFSNKADSSSLTSLSGTVTGHTSDTTIHVTSSDKTAWNAKADLSDIPSVTGYADSVKYNSTSKEVEFYHGGTGGTKVFFYDASPFLIDGMVSNVEIKNVTSGSSQVTCLVISFNTDAGKQDINIPISQIFDASNYYTIAQTDTKISEATSGKVDNSAYTAYTSTTATEIGNKLSTNDFNTYSGTVNTELGNKASQSDLNTLSGTVTAHTADSTIHHSHTNKTYLDSITGTVGTMAYQNTTSYSSATQVNTALGNKVDTSEYSTFSAATNNSIADLSGQSETIAAALVNLNDNKLDVTAYTDVDVSNYYKKTETSGSTQIADALTAKTDVSTFNTHTGSSVHLSTTEKTNLDSLATNIASISGITSTKVSNWDAAYTSAHTHSNKSALDAITGNIGTMAYENTTSYSSATQVSTALSEKVDNTTYSGFSSTTNTAISDLSGQSETVAAALANLNDRLIPIEDDDIIAQTTRRRTRTDFTSKGIEWFKSTLKKAIADQDLEKYGMRVGDYCSVTHGTKTYNYVIAGLNTMYGTYTPYRLNVNHVGIIVDTNDTHAWNTSSSTTQSENTYSTGGTWTTGSSAAGYANCDLHYYLTTTVLGNVETDLGSANLKSHYKLYSNNVNSSGYNRFGSAGGCSSGWDWYHDQKICALSEVQVYGSTVWSSSGYDTGEACRQLDVFRVYNMNEIFEGRYPWLRDVASASRACNVYSNGIATNSYASLARYVAALILFA